MNFYTDIFIKGKKVRTKPLDFSANIKENKVCYNFRVKVGAPKASVAAEFYDKDSHDYTKRNL